VNVLVDPQSIRSALPGRMRPLRRVWCYVAAVGLPTALIFVYLMFVASPQYVTEYRYSIYSGASTTDNSQSALTATLQGNPSVHADYVVNDYIHSRAAVEELRKRMHLVPLFRAQGFDPVFHFWWDNGSIERLYRYWNAWVLDADFDRTELLGFVSVRTFTPQDSLRIANVLIELSEAVVNDLGSRSREDAVRVADETAKRATERMDQAREALRAFREAQHTYSPAKPADTTETLAATLRQNTVTLNAQLESLTHTLSPTAPAVLSLKNQIEATNRELDRVSNMLGDTGITEAGHRRSLPGELGIYEGLQQEVNFAATAREAALRHLEQVRFDASTQHMYMQVHAKPSLAQSAIYPKPIRWTLLSFVTLTVFWLIGTLLYYSIREHGG
jgi:capsular polysaccharide transport system permease protein